MRTSSIRSTSLAQTRKISSLGLSAFCHIPPVCFACKYILLLVLLMVYINAIWGRDIWVEGHRKKSRNVVLIDTNGSFAPPYTELFLPRTHLFKDKEETFFCRKFDKKNFLKSLPIRCYFLNQLWPLL